MAMAHSVDHIAAFKEAP